MCVYLPGLVNFNGSKRNTYLCHKCFYPLLLPHLYSQALPPHPQPSPLHLFHKMYRSMKLSFYLVCVFLCVVGAFHCGRDIRPPVHILCRRAASSVVSKCGPRTSSFSITWKLVRDANSQPPPTPPELRMQEVWRWGPSKLCFNKSSRI